jgi:hypothetical protein
MQPICDSVRLEKETAFPLLPLTETDTKFDFVLLRDGHYRPFKVSLKLRDMRMITFQPGPNPPGMVVADKSMSTGEWIFKGTASPESEFAWIGELREGWAHYYANKFAYETSRVGVNDSEWARRWK